MDNYIGFELNQQNTKNLKFIINILRLIFYSGFLFFIIMIISAGNLFRKENIGVSVIFVLIFIYYIFNLYFIRKIYTSYKKAILTKDGTFLKAGLLSEADRVVCMVICWILYIVICFVASFLEVNIG